MGFYSQFKTFNPLSSDVPSSPFSIMPDIAWRARALLEDRTIEQVTSIAEVIDWLNDEYFNDLYRGAIEYLRTSRRINISDYGELLSDYLVDKNDKETLLPMVIADYFDFTYSDRITLTKGTLIDLDIPTASNTSEVDALKESIGRFDEVLTADNGVDGIKSHEVFASLSLWMIADAMKFLDTKSWSNDLVFMDGLRNEINKITGGYPSVSIAVSLAGEATLKAMDAVCYAEHLRDTAQLRAAYEKEQMQAARAMELEKAHADYRAELAEQKKQRSERLSAGRHQKTNEAKGLVTTEWEKDPSKFISATKAGDHFSVWLKEKGLGFEPRTVTGWISAHAKQKGINLR